MRLRSDRAATPGSNQARGHSSHNRFLQVACHLDRAYFTQVPPLSSSSSSFFPLLPLPPFLSSSGPSFHSISIPLADALRIRTHTLTRSLSLNKRRASATVFYIPSFSRLYRTLWPSRAASLVSRVFFSHFHLSLTTVFHFRSILHTGPTFVCRGHLSLTVSTHQQRDFISRLTHPRRTANIPSFHAAQRSICFPVIPKTPPQSRDQHGNLGDK